MELIQLRAGPLVRVDALRLALDLEQRGVTLRIDHGQLKAAPAALLTPADIAAIKGVKFHLLAIVGYAPSDAHLRDTHGSAVVASAHATEGA